MAILLAFSLSSCKGINNNKTSSQGDTLEKREIEKEVLFEADCQYSKAEFIIAHSQFGWNYYSESGDVVITKLYDLETFNNELIQLLSPEEVNEMGFYNFWVESKSCSCVEIMLSIVKEDTDYGYSPLIKVCGKEASYLREL